MKTKPPLALTWIESGVEDWIVIVCLEMTCAFPVESLYNSTG
ncbi:MAG: hypothetical protein ABI036_02425 [Fibrobacteria bacterium]